VKNHGFFTYILAVTQTLFALCMGGNMSNQGMKKECKFCGARFAQSVKLCPNCGSVDIKLVAQEGMEYLETVSRESENAEQVGYGKQKTKKKWKKVIVILVSVLVGVFALLIVVSQLFIRWADKVLEKDKLSLNEQVEQVLEDSEMSDEEWKEAMLPLLDELYSFHMDKEIAEVFDEALSDDRPISAWEHYLYASCLSDFYALEEIWEYEKSGKSFTEVHYQELLYYGLEMRSSEENEELATEERERLQWRITKVYNDVTTRFDLSDEEWNDLYGKAIEEHGFVDYELVKEFLKNRDSVLEKDISEYTKPIENIEEALKATESLYGVEWQKAMFPILNQLFKQNEYKTIYDVYVGVKLEDTYKPIAHWEHYLYARALYDIYDIEKVLEIEASGEQIKEWQYINLLMDYFTFEDFEDRTNLTEEEKEKLMPVVIKLREDAISRWNLSQEEWEELRNRVVSEYNVISYEKTERFVEAWMEKNGYTNDVITIEEEIIDSIDLDDETWKKRFIPKLDEIYEKGADEELYNAVMTAHLYGRSNGVYQWQHKDYVDMLSEYYDAERKWGYENAGTELDKYDYTHLLYAYLLYEHWETNMSLSQDEMERLKPYRDKILQDGDARWNFTENEWKELISDNRKIYYYVVADFVEQWLEN